MEGFRQKTEKELQGQIDTATETLETDITQPSSYLEIFKLSLEEIKTKYPERYATYLSLVRAQKNNQEIDANELQEIQEWISSLNNLDSYITKHTPHYEKFEVRDKRQFHVFEDIRDSLEQGEKEGYIKLPTGVGKTVLFSRVVESLGLKTLIVVPSKILVGQTGERLEEFTDVEFGKFFQGEKNLSENVTITTYSSLVGGIKNGTINPDEYHALILDEAHKALGEETSKAVRQFKGVKLGFTATPKFSEDRHVSDLLEHEIHSMGIVEAAREGLISRFKSYIAYTDTDLSTVEVKNRERYNENELERAIDQEGRNQSAVELYKKEFDGQIAIAYCGGVTHAKHVAELFNAAGVSAEIISGDTPDDKSSNGKEAILERFRTGKTKILCNARILIEGFDEPKASVCLNLHPTLSLVDTEQRAGRVLRIDPENPDKWAYIVDFIDREPRVTPRTFSEIAEASEVDGDRAVTFDIEDTGDVAVGERKEKQRVPDVDIKGLRVVVDTREVLSISHGFAKERLKGRIEFLSLHELQREVREAGINSSKEYKKVRKTHIDWPSNPDVTYKDSGWISWYDFLGKESKEVGEFLDFDKLKIAILEAKIKTVEEYRKKQRNHSDWPSTPEETYKHLGWISWYDFFGKEKKEFLAFDELKLSLKESGINNQREYLKERKNHNGWPVNPNKAYENSGWISWDDLFGKEKKEFLTLDSLKAAVQKINIENQDQYNMTQKDHPDWPSAPAVTYKDSGWVSWNDLFGREKKSFLTLNELKGNVRKEGIDSRRKYQEERKDHLDWPSAPEILYKDNGWISWDDLLGKEKKEFVTIDELKNIVREMNINSARNYAENQKKHTKWPTRPDHFYKNSGWVSWDDLFGR